MSDVPIIDVGPLVAGGTAEEVDAVGRAIDAACRQVGFFTIVGHDVPTELVARLDTLARAFFARPEAEKAQIAMARGGRAWRGWFPVGGELTAGTPDEKEGLYVGTELAADDPRVRAGRPLHGPNLFPTQPAELGPTILAYLDRLTALGHALLRGMAVGLGLAPDWFQRDLTADPLVLFRLFHYPPAEPRSDGWGVGEHTDYGLLTILRQDDTGGLEVQGPHGWQEVEPVPGSFVVNLGDMLDRMTEGRYRSTRHRVRLTAADRLSMPFFFDPGWDAEVRPIPFAADDPPPPDDVGDRWDGASVHAWSGTYGDYLLAKVAKVFPGLTADVLDG